MNHTNLLLFISGPSHFTHRGHSYWFSEDEAAYAGTKVDWLEARNICRRHCMDLVSIETPAEHNMIASFLTESKYQTGVLYDPCSLYDLYDPCSLYVLYDPCSLCMSYMILVSYV